MSFRVCSLFTLYIVASHVTLIDAAPFTHFFARDAGSSSATGFRLQNGINAQQLNAQFATLTASDSCTGDVLPSLSVCRILILLYLQWEVSLASMVLLLSA